MTNNQLERVVPEKIVAREKEDLRKPYFKPHLEELGDLRSLTLGPTPGTGESGNPLTFLGF